MYDSLKEEVNVGCEKVEIFSQMIHSFTISGWTGLK